MDEDEKLYRRAFFRETGKTPEEEEADSVTMLRIVAVCVAVIALGAGLFFAS